MPYGRRRPGSGNPAAADQWPEGATLAELFALRDGTMPVGTPETESSAGLYL